MDRPRPTPPLLLVRSAPSRRNGSNSDVAHPVNLCIRLHIDNVDGAGQFSFMLFQSGPCLRPNILPLGGAGMFLSTGWQNARFWVVDVAEHAAALGEPNAKCPVM
jgi:hypothetical protein